MDILSFQQSLKCTKHPNQNIMFVQVNQLQDNKQIFYCDICLLYDCEFKISNYVQYQQVIESKTDSSIVNWPPFEENQLKIQICKMLNKDKNQADLSSQISQFFDKMKKEILSKIDDCYKQTMRKVQELPQYEDQILETLQEFKLIDSFKTILQNQNSEMNTKEGQWREFINQVNKEMQNYTKKIKQLFEKQKYIEEIVDFETPNKMKDNILQQIENINFFKKDYKQNQQQQCKSIDLLPNFQIIQSGHNQNKSKNQKMIKLENNSIQIISSENCYGSYYSNLILDRNKKYIFRFQIKRNNQKHGGLAIGLVRDETKDIQHTYYDKLVCLISYSDKNNGHVSNYGIDKWVKGDLSVLKEIDCLELRVCVQDKLLEVVDYPNYNLKYEITDEQKANLSTYQSLRVGIYLGNAMQVSLISVNMCDEFEIED